MAMHEKPMSEEIVVVDPEDVEDYLEWRERRECRGCLEPKAWCQNCVYDPPLLNDAARGIVRLSNPPNDEIPF